MVKREEDFITPGGFPSTILWYMKCLDKYSNYSTSLVGSRYIYHIYIYYAMMMMYIPYIPYMVVICYIVVYIPFIIF